jgi:hypothetical protein
MEDDMRVHANKTAEMKRACDVLALALGWDGVESHCRACNKQVWSFRDQLSEEEYIISGLCQRCQDSIFSQEDEIDWGLTSLPD